MTAVSLGRSEALKTGVNKVVDSLADIAITWASEEAQKGPLETFALVVFNVNSISKDPIYQLIHAFVFFLASVFIMHTSSALGADDANLLYIQYFWN